MPECACLPAVAPRLGCYAGRQAAAAGQRGLASGMPFYCCHFTAARRRRAGRRGPSHHRCRCHKPRRLQPGEPGGQMSGMLGRWKTLSPLSHGNPQCMARLLEGRPAAHAGEARVHGAERVRAPVRESASACVALCAQQCWPAHDAPGTAPQFCPPPPRSPVRRSCSRRALISCSMSGTGCSRTSSTCGQSGQIRC